MAEKDQKIALNNEFNPMIVGVILRKHWFLPLLYTLIFSTLAFFYIRYTKPIFRSSSVIQIIQDDQTSNVLGTESLMSDKNILSTEIELLKSDVLFSKAISKLNLETSIYAEGEILTQDLYRTAPFEIIIYQLSDSSLLDKRIDFKSNDKDEITLYIGENKLIAGKFNEHLVSKKFDLFIRTINKDSLGL